MLNPPDAITSTLAEQLLADSRGFPCDPAYHMVIVILDAAKRANPNGKIPGGDPRQDLDDHGYYSVGSLKRGMRDTASDHYKLPIYQARGANLTETMASIAYTIPGEVGKNGKKAKDTVGYRTDELMARNWDLRVFGGTLAEAGRRVTGAIQFGDAVTVDPVYIEEVPFTTVTVRNRKGASTLDTDTGELVEGELYEGGNMNVYRVVAFGLYRAHGALDVAHGRANNLTEADLAVLWAGIFNGWEDRKSAHRMDIARRHVYCFVSPKARCIEPSHVTAARVQVQRKDGVELGDRPASRYEDYMITVNPNTLPKGMALYSYVDGVVTITPARV